MFIHFFYFYSLFCRHCEPNLKGGEIKIGFERNSNKKLNSQLSFFLLLESIILDCGRKVCFFEENKNSFTTPKNYSKSLL